MEITLAKALKQKKRVAAEISKLEADIRSNNSMSKNATREVDVTALLNRRTYLVNYMIALKLAINEANRPIMAQVEDSIRRSQEAIDKIQEKLDTFNYTTTLVVPDWTAAASAHVIVPPVDPNGAVPV